MTLNPTSPSRSPSITWQRWVKRNLFDGWFNTLLTIALLTLISWGAISLLRWATQAQWTVITANLRLFLVGRYPNGQIWRVWAALAIVLTMLGTSLIQSKTQKVEKLKTQNSKLRAISYFLLPISLLLILWLLAGGFGLPRVETNLWGGLLLTLVVAITSTVLAFPLGVLLATA